MNLPVALRICLRAVQTRKLLSVAPDYMAANHGVHEPEAHLGMVVVTVEVFFLQD